MKKWNEISPFTGSNIGEDAPTNSAGSGSVAGLGVGPMGEPGVKKRKKQSLIDARSKAYRQHRERLETSRLKRQESRNKRDKFTESIVSEMTYGAGTMAAARPTADMSNINAAKSSSGYELYHKDFSSAMQHAYKFAKSKGYIVDPKDIDSKVATGPKKPSSGKTNSYILGTNKKQNLHVQVANLDNKRYELNMYID
jgi:hypothetical protein|tara:strand:+ start:544 stop:1134 length:591 start_codon:yes stop_codon:yes gene_type:complete